MNFFISVFVYPLHAVSPYPQRSFTRPQDLEPFERCEATFTLCNSFEPHRRRYILSISLLIPL